MNGFLLIDKPKNMTSHDVVSFVKRKFKIDKIGHTGTLDPFATGLLILSLGKATKLSAYISNQDKCYEGIITFGKHYDTYDTTGQIIKESQTQLQEIDIKKMINNMVGSYYQTPPMYSAIKKNGVKAYQLARKGQEIKLEERCVHIYDFKATSSYASSQIHFSTHVSKGTYIRSLAVDLAKNLNTYAALSALRRTKIGSYDISDAKSLDNLELSDLIDLEQYFSRYEKLVLSDYLIHLVKNGVYLDHRQIITDQPFVVYNQALEMIALYDVEKEHVYKPIIIL